MGFHVKLRERPGIITILLKSTALLVYCNQYILYINTYISTMNIICTQALQRLYYYASNFYFLKNNNIVIKILLLG